MNASLLTSRSLAQSLEANFCSSAGRFANTRRPPAQRWSSILQLAAVYHPRFRLFPDDFHEVAHREVGIDEMQAPVRQQLAVCAEITDDIVCAGIGPIAMLLGCDWA